MPANHTIHVHAHKTDRARERDVVVIERGERKVVLAAWRQGVPPHELVHAAIEATFGLRGFVRLVAAGRDPKDISHRDASTDLLLAEALTNAFQMEMSGLVERGNEHVRALFEEQTAGNADACAAVLDHDLDRCRALLEDLTQRWSRLAPGEGLDFELRQEPTPR